MLGLLVVVYEIPYTVAVVCEPGKMKLVCSHRTTVSGTTCVRIIVQYVTTSLLLRIVYLLIVQCIISLLNKSYHIIRTWYALLYVYQMNA